MWDPQPRMYVRPHTNHITETTFRKSILHSIRTLTLVSLSSFESTHTHDALTYHTSTVPFSSYFSNVSSEGALSTSFRDS